MKISFDYDGTLDDIKMQKLADMFVSEGYEVHIITSRVKHTKWNDKVFKTAKKLSIPKENIHFTEGTDKYHIISELAINIHFDDETSEIDMIEENCISCCPLLVSAYHKDNLECNLG